MKPHADRLRDLLARTDEEWEALQDAHVTVASFRAGRVLSEADIDALTLIDKEDRDDQEAAHDAYDRGLADGRREAGGADVAALLAKLDEKATEAMQERGLRRFYSALAAQPPRASGADDRGATPNDL